MRGSFAHWKSSFYAGLAVVLPAVISIAVVKWLLGTLANVTNPLLFFFPREWTHDAATGKLHWWSGALTVVLAIVLIAVLGQAARYYIGKQIIAGVDLLLLKVPLLNKIYGALKQVNEALTTNNKTAFRQVVLIPYPGPGLRSVAFVTGEQLVEASHRTQEDLVCVFLPKAPNPATGYIILVPRRDIIPLEMSISDGIKYVISFGTVAPPYTPPPARGARADETNELAGAGANLARRNG